MCSKKVFESLDEISARNIKILKVFSKRIEMLFKSKIKDYSIQLDGLRIETKNMLGQMQSGNFEIRGDDQNIHHDSAEVIKDINMMIELMKDSMEYIITRFELVNKTTNVGLWDMDVIAGDPVNPNNKFTWTDEFRHMLGYSNENDFPNVLSSWGSRLHPDDYDRVMEDFGNHLLDYSGRTPYSLDYRLKLKNGNYEWFHAEGETIRDHKGVPLCVAGSIKNITNEKMKEHVEIELAKNIEDFSYIMGQMVESIESITVTAQELASDQENTMKAAQEMKVNANETKKITDFIKNLADQTNLLGLNATIEAAHSGKEGNGFHVVAVEIRKLSISSVDAVDQIENSLDAINGSIDDIFQNIKKTDAIIQTQAATTEEVSALVEEIKKMAEELFTLAKKMK